MSPIVLLLIAVAVFVLWHFLPQTEKRPPEPKPRYRLDPRVRPDELQWQSFVEEHCESPAETAFLRAMIEAFDMRPEGGSLMAEDVRLDFQVEEGRYRVDFLVNEWLVVEIDGAAYHSSPEAKSRDQMRDRYFEGLGYSVLRIPAKLVFQTPAQAVGQVRSALGVGKRKVEAPASNSAKPNGFTRLAKTAAAFSQSVELAERKHAVTKALSNCELAVSAEKSTLDAAFDLAKQRMEHAAWVDGLTADGLDLYEQCLADIEEGVATDDPSPTPSTHRKFETPATTGDPWVDAKVAECFPLHVDRRAATLQSMKARLAGDPAVRAHMRTALMDLGREDLWVHVS